MNPRQTTLHILLAALMLTSVLPVATGTSDPATDAQEAALRTYLTSQGTNGPTGNLATLGNAWETHNEIHHLYLLTSMTANYNGLRDDDTGPDFATLYDPVGNNVPDQAGGPTAGDLTFTVGNSGPASELFGMSTRLFVASNAAATVSAQLFVDGVSVAQASVRSGGEVTNPSIPVGGATFYPGELTSSVTFSPPVQVPAGKPLALVIHAEPSVPTDTVPFYWGHIDAPSSVDLIMDSARSMLWTENLGDQVRDAFPTPVSASTNDRTMQVRVVHLDALGDLATFASDNSHRHTLRVIGPDGKVYYDNAGASIGNPNLAGTRNADPDKVWGAVKDDLARTGNGVTGQNGLNAVTYQIAYPTTTPPGVYRLELSDVNDEWVTVRQVLVGASTATLAPSVLDPAMSKQILVGERTSFRFTVTNLGSTTDTFALTPTLGATPIGWSATVTPSQVTLTPGQTVDAFLNVAPSVLGTNGQSNTVTVSSTSVSSGVSTTCPAQCLVYTVSLTSTKNVLAPAIVVSTSSVDIGPGSSRIIPVAVENRGNARDQFTLSTQGVPLGWTVSLNPSTLDLDARSSVSPILRIEAPASAARGTEFNFTLRASRVENLAAKAEQTFHVRVFLQDRMLFRVQGADGQLIDTSSVTAPVVHLLRDEGPDGDVRAATCPQNLPQCPVIQSPGSTAWDANNDPDSDYDQSTLFRLALTNDGDRPDAIQLLPKVVTGRDGRSTALASAAQQAVLGLQDFDGCEGDNDSNSNGDGFNDGWRFRLFDVTSPAIPALPGQGAANRQTYDAVAAMGTTVTVPAHTTKYVYAELGWFLPTPEVDSEACGVGANDVQGDGVSGTRDADPAPGHAVAIEAVSGNDPSQRTTHVLNARIIGAIGGLDNSGAPGSPGTTPTRSGSQTYSDQRNGVEISPDLASGTQDLVTKSVSLASRVQTYRLRAVNTGDEVDTLQFEVPQFQQNVGAQNNGWEYGFQNITVNPNLMAHNLAERANVGTCTAPSVSGSKVVFECTMGAWDEVSFQLKATAPNDNARLGTADAVRVTVTSKDSRASSLAKTDDVVLTTTLTGTYIFNLLPDVTSASVQAYPGVPAPVPFTLRNLGTNPGNFSIDIVSGPANATGWRGDLSHATAFVPAGRDLDGFLLVTPPSTAAAGAVERFRVRATSLDAPAPKPTDLLDIVATVAAKPATLSLTGFPKDVVGAPGQEVPVTVRANRTGAADGSTVTLRLDGTSLAPGWAAVGSQVATATYAGGSAQATFHVRAPADAIGTSRATVRLTAEDGSQSAFAYVGVSLQAPSVGIRLTSPLGSTLLVAPGSPTDLTLRLENLGVGVENVAMSTEALPTGWIASFESSSVAVQPLQNRTFHMTVTAPATLQPGQSRLVRVVATPSDATKLQRLDLNFTTGQSVPVLRAKVTGTQHLLPLEPFRFVVTVANNGTLTDQLNLVPALSGAFKDVVKMSFDPATVQLEPGKAVDVSVEATLPAGLAPGTQVPLQVAAKSKGPYLNATGTTTLAAVVMEYRVRDVDGDGVDEYAVDRDLDLANGYEAFRDLSASPSRLVDAASMLSAEASARNTVMVTGADGNATPVLRFLFDPDADGKTDMLVDRDADGKPDVYWDPDRGYSHTIPLLKDVTKDGRDDYFFDLDGESGFHLDVAYDPVEGKVLKLIQVDIDNNGVLDYVVDSNGNGSPDPSETVLFNGPDGKLASIRETADVDGDGKPDTVIDTNADGKPDYFLPNGKTAAVPIVLEDVTGDGIDDWTYDSDGDGRRDAYYDPATQESGFIDAQGSFVDELAKYWYVGALFGLVLVLFVVLLLVTRK